MRKSGSRRQIKGVSTPRLKLKSLPKTIFVARRPDGDGGFFFAVEAKAERLAELTEVVRIGRYELTEYGDVKAIPTVLPIPSGRRR